MGATLTRWDLGLFVLPFSPRVQFSHCTPITLRDGWRSDSACGPVTTRLRVRIPVETKICSGLFRPQLSPSSTSIQNDEFERTLNPMQMQMQISFGLSMIFGLTRFNKVSLCNDPSASVRPSVCPSVLQCVRAKPKPVAGTGFTYQKSV